MDLEEGRSVERPQRASLPQETAKGSCPSEPEFAHYKSTTQLPSEESSRDDPGLQESVAEGSVLQDAVTCSGLPHVTLAMAVGAASDRLADRLARNPEWRDVVEAAYQLRHELGISQANWATACAVLGRTGAALCLLVTDRATLRSEDPVERPAAYFRGMVNRAEWGELRLHRSLFGLLSRNPASGNQET